MLTLSASSASMVTVVAESLERTTCPTCGKDVAITKSGRIFTHRDDADPSLYRRCDGSKEQAK